MENSFSFVVPECSAGDVLKVTIPDGSMALQIPIPQNVQPGDTMYMSKDTNGKWGISKVTRGENPKQKPPASAPTAEWRSKEDLAKDLASPGTKSVVLHTTKGPLLLTLVPEWAPCGVERFCQLVKDQHFSQIAVYRGVAGFLIQFGIPGTPGAKTYEKIPDDPLIGIPIEEGSVCFAASGPNTRKNTICLWLGDFPSFGKSPWETPVGKVCPESLPVLHSIFTGYGDIPQCRGSGPDPHKLEELGNEYIKANFPKIDFITGAQFA